MTLKRGALVIQPSLYIPHVHLYSNLINFSNRSCKSRTEQILPVLKGQQEYSTSLQQCLGSYFFCGMGVLIYIYV